MSQLDILRGHVVVVTGPPGDWGGPVFALVAVVLVATCYLLLVRRYRGMRLAPMEKSDELVQRSWLAPIGRRWKEMVGDMAPSTIADPDRSGWLTSAPRRARLVAAT